VSWLRRFLFPVRHTPAAPQSQVDPLEWIRAFGRPKSWPKWDYVPMTGPYRIWRCDDDEAAAMRGFSAHDMVADAIIAFSRLHHPRVGQCCILADGDDQVLLAWADNHHGELDLRFHWWGCRLAFEMLSVLEPVNTAVWEQIAYEGVLNR
jgi:hypothetical protein